MTGSPDTRRSVLVAGGTGFIGGWIVKELRQSGNHVVAVGRQGLGHALLEEYDAIVWSAGGPGKDSSELHEQHVAGPLRAMSSLREAGHFVYLSSGQVYGAIEVPFVETARTQATSPYALAKLEGEKCLGELAMSEGKRFTSLRVSLAYGPGQSGGMFVPSLLDHLAKRIPFETTAGEQTRDYIFVSDIAKAVTSSLSSPNPGGLLNLGSSEEAALKDVATAITTAFDQRFGTESQHLLKLGALDYRESEQMRYVLSMYKAKELLGFVSKVSLKQGIEHLIREFHAPESLLTGRRS
ncbi:MAG: NAD(P)-dependent oxidoreductase [Kofleriaceae bacterium]|nr:NAD(P)-dependent oxidoreductase [Kofleriaceae bacterium]